MPVKFNSGFIRPVSLRKQKHGLEQARNRLVEQRRQTRATPIAEYVKRFSEALPQKLSSLAGIEVKLGYHKSHELDLAVHFENNRAIHAVVAIRKEGSRVSSVIEYFQAFVGANEIVKKFNQTHGYWSNVLVKSIIEVSKEMDFERVYLRDVTTAKWYKNPFISYGSLLSTDLYIELQKKAQDSMRRLYGGTRDRFRFKKKVGHYYYIELSGKKPN